MAAKGNSLKKNKQISEPEEEPQKRKKTVKSSRPAWLTDGRVSKIFGVFLILLGIYLLFAFTSYLFQYFSWDADDIFSQFSFKEIFTEDTEEAENWAGRLGAALSILLIKKGFGVASFLFLLILFVAGLKLSLKISILPLWKTIVNSLIGVVWITVAMGFLVRNTSYAILGGTTGYQSAYWLEGLLGKTGTAILLFFTLIAILVFAFNMPLSLPKPPSKVDEIDNPESAEINGDFIISPEERKNTSKLTGVLPEDKYNTIEYALNEEEDEIDGFLYPKENLPDIQESKDVEFTIEQSPEQILIPDSEEEYPEPEDNKIHYTIDTEFDPTLDLPDYKRPTLDLLDEYVQGNVSYAAQKEELEANKDRIVETLGNYGITIDKIKATIGPTVTLYEIIPAKGVRISKIRNLEDDIALSLAAMGIRIIAPIPGKGTIGIEVPNLKPEIVPMKSILGSEKFMSTKYDLPFGIGKTIQNEPYIVDLSRLPHILMAGATGQGKSVGLNAIITSILYCKHPSEVKFIMIDPKKVELTLFSKIERHFLAKLPDSEEAIITDTRKVVRTLNSLNIEMENRYDLLKDAQVRNIKEYNTRFIARKLSPLHGHRFLPYLIVVIDEYADLIMTAGKEIEVPLTLLAQKARAIGIHLVIATQRPSVNIITGTIKANFPARIAFRVISKIDSRTILDSGGADQLVGRGDMLLSSGSDLLRLQCAFVDTHEVERITDFIGSQRGYPDAYHLPEFSDEQDEKEAVFDPQQRDELFEDAARIIVATQQGSTSLLQRKLKLGYNRAGRIIDQLEAAGIVGPFEGSKAREVRVANELALEQFLKDLYLD
jgi:DNA segregation ATPase FtsK/SpoIIIE, S-DNA-T family